MGHRSWDRSHPWPHSEFKTSVGYIEQALYSLSHILGLEIFFRTGNIKLGLVAHTVILVSGTERQEGQ